MSRAAVLIVEDEVSISEAVVFQLQRDDYATRAVGSGEAALEAVRESPPDLILLDINLPGMDGLEVCQALRAGGFVAPILLLTARGDEIDRVVGLEVGADDYLVKPFSSRELLARVKAHLRRERRRPVEAGSSGSSGPSEVSGGAAAPGGSARVSASGVTIDPGAREVLADGRLLDLSPREFDLLWVLWSHRGQVLTRDQLLEKVWGYDFEGESRVVNVTIGRLREKLERDARNPTRLRTSRGVGYRLVL